MRLINLPAGGGGGGDGAGVGSFGGSGSGSGSTKASGSGSGSLGGSNVGTKWWRIFVHFIRTSFEVHYCNWNSV